MYSRAKYDAISEAAAAPLAQLCDVLLTLQYLPAMPLGALEGMGRPNGAAAAGVAPPREAARAKLLRQAAALAAQVLRAAEQLAEEAQVSGGGGKVNSHSELSSLQLRPSKQRFEE